MNQMILDSLDSRLEALCILQRLTDSAQEAREQYEFVNIHADCRYLARRFHMREDEAFELLAPQRHIYDAVTAELRSPHDDILYYFSMLEPQTISLARIHCNYLRLAELLPGGAPDMLARAFADSIADDHHAQEDLPETSAAGFAAWLGKQELCEQARWRAFDFYLNYERHSQIICSILNEAQALFEKHAHLADDMVRRCVSRLRQTGSSVLNDEMMRGFDSCIIVPQFFAYASLHIRGESAFLTERGLSPQTMVHYGVLIDEISDLRSARVSDADELLRGLRSLGDKSRLQILTALRQHPMFGYELVELTGLSAATISHHINELFNRDLITMERQGTSMRYALRSDNLAQLLEGLRGLLL